jgi:acetyl esterase/lipase
MKVAKYPAAVEDVQCAIRWIRKNAESYGIDPDRMALVGGSAGGHLAMMAGYTSDGSTFHNGCSDLDSVSASVKAIVNLYGPYDLTTPYAIGRDEVKDFLDGNYEDMPKVYEEASPKWHLTSDDPPTLIFHGTIDSLVPISQADSLASALSKAGVPYDYHRLKGWPHTMDISSKVNAYCQFYMDRFFEKYL